MRHVDFFDESMALLFERLKNVVYAIHDCKSIGLGPDFRCGDVNVVTPAKAGTQFNRSRSFILSVPWFFAIRIVRYKQSLRIYAYCLDRSE